MKNDKNKIALLPGDGIGPEISECVVDLASALAPGLEWVHLAHEEAYAEDPSSFWEKCFDCSAVLKGPTTTPQGSGRRSLNVMMRTSMGLYANVRPVRSFEPFIKSNASVDMLIVRENEEDLYVGMEYQQSPDQAHAIKISTSHAARRISEYAFGMCTLQGRKKVTCMTKDNIMKITDGTFSRCFREVASHYPSIASDHKIIDIGAALVASNPEKFEVIVTTNLYGDIISDIAAQITGSVGMAGSANIGDSYAMFEAIHGSAPDIAGLGIANPSGMLAATVMMMSYLGYVEESKLLEGAWLKTIEDGVTTRDIPCGKNVGTKEFASEISRRLGDFPAKLPLSRPFLKIGESALPTSPPVPPAKESFSGVDVFVLHRESGSVETVSKTIASLADQSGLVVESVFNRGSRVEPSTSRKAWMSDQWRYRVLFTDPPQSDVRPLWEFVSKLANSGARVLRVETLRSGGYSD